jgi:hypothetical protein
VTLKLLDPVGIRKMLPYITDECSPSSRQTAFDLMLFTASLSRQGRSVYRKRAEPVNTTRLHHVSLRGAPDDVKRFQVGDSRLEDLARERQTQRREDWYTSVVLSYYITGNFQSRRLSQT